MSLQLDRSPRVAIVHEWFTDYAGSERVVEQLLHLFPQADLFALVDTLPAADRWFLRGRSVQTSFLQRWPWRRRFRTFVGLMPMAVEQFDLSSYDLVLSSNHAVAKGVITGPEQLHVSYVHTPMRYAWDLQHQYLRQAGLTRGLKSQLARWTLHYLRQWDQSSSQRVDHFLANSKYIARRIRKCYRRPAKVVYPPVDTERFQLSLDRDDYYLAAARFVPYKRMDLIVTAFTAMPHRRLIILGDGPERARIQAQAGPNVEFLGHQPAARFEALMQRAAAYVFAAEEDFGITPVEAQACGTPVVAFGRGGATETVIDGETGVLFPQQSPESICAAVDRLHAIGPLDPHRIRAQAERFGPDVFRQQMCDVLTRAWNEFLGGSARPRHRRRSSKAMPRG